MFVSFLVHPGWRDVRKKIVPENPLLADQEVPIHIFSFSNEVLLSFTAFCVGMASVSKVDVCDDSELR